MEDESIKKILESTGLSCDALLEKLKEYKLMASQNEPRVDDISEKNCTELEEKSSAEENFESENNESGIEEAVELRSDVPKIFDAQKESQNPSQSANPLESSDIDQINNEDCTSSTLNHTAEDLTSEPDLNPELGDIPSNNTNTNTHEDIPNSLELRRDSSDAAEKSDNSKNKEIAEIQIQPTTNKSTEEIKNVTNEGSSLEENVESTTTTLEPFPDVGKEIQHTSDNTVKYQISLNDIVSCNEISSTESDDNEEKKIPNDKEDKNIPDGEVETSDIAVDSDEVKKNDTHVDEGIVSSSVHADITINDDGKEHISESIEPGSDDEVSNDSETGKSLEVDDPVDDNDNDDIFYEDEDEENASKKVESGADKNGMRVPSSDDSMEGDRCAQSSNDESDSEDIRNILKLQLNNLRSKRKDEFKIDSVLSPILIRNPKKKLFPELLLSLPQESEETNQKAQNNENIIDTTEDFGFLISDVVGGVDINESETKSSVEEDEEEDDSNKELHEMEKIKLTKTTDITKIKGWKRKKFSSALEADDDSQNVNPVEAIRKIISKRDALKNVNEKTALNETIQNVEDTSNNSTDSDRIASTNCINLNEIQPRLEQEQLNVNSPFVSNTLDEFLNSNAKLNISYQVPMLYAVEGIGVCKELSPTSKKVIPNSEDKHPGIKSSLTKLVPAVKAKTLAEKRRILEQINKKKQKEAKKKWKKSRQSYAIYNGKEIWLTSRSKEVYLGTIINDPESKKSGKIESPFKRPSLLNSLLEKPKQTATYKAGPLSRKNDLQDDDSKKSWETLIKKLPQVYLNIVPEFRKPIPIEVRKFIPNFGWELNPVRTEFALSALINNNSKEKRFFKIPLPYLNSEKNIIVRRNRSLIESFEEPLIPVQDVVKSRTEPSSVEEEVANIIEDLLKYIEIKEISESLLKDDKTCDYNDYSPNVVDQPLLKKNCKELGENISTFFRKTKRKSKVDYELSRLNCKVVNVTLEKDDNSNCKKPFCRLGCVCQSLTCTNIFSFHCKKVDCMFQCTCPKQRYQGFDDDILLPAGTDLFSQDAVNRISDQAKRNLAKEEKEFTQTIIYANNQAIIVGSSNGRANARRLKRPPKKFTDFEDPDKVDSDFVHRVDPKMTTKCTVMLRKLNLDKLKLVPLCLEHSEYDCGCDRSKTGIREKTESASASASASANASPSAGAGASDTTKTELVGNNYYQSGKSTRYSDKPRKRYSGMDTSSDQEEMPRKRKRIEIAKHNAKSTESRAPKVSSSPIIVEEPTDTCARIREVFTSYKLRNSTPEFAKILHNKFKLASGRHHIGLVPNDLRVEYVENGSKTCSENLQDYLQTVISVSGSGVHLMLNKAERFKAAVVKSISPKPKLPIDTALDSTTPIFEGEEIITKANDEQFFRKNLVLKNSKISTVRILPWKFLVRGFLEKSLFIAQTASKQPDLYVSKPGGSFPGGTHTILPGSMRRGISDVLKYISEKKNPLEDSRILLYAVLIPCDDKYFHFNALYLKNLKTNQKYVFPDLNRYNSSSFGVILNGLAQRTFQECLSSQLTAGQKPEEQAESGCTNSSGEECTSNTMFHRNLKGVLCFLTLTKHNISESIEFEEFTPAEDAISFLDKDHLRDLTFALPRTQLQWRMIYMSDFTYLSLVKSDNYSIKYTDLISAFKMSRDMNLTISLSSDALSSGYIHPKFGIYFTPNHMDKLFIGPYNKNESHGIETLRYMQTELVKADLLDEMLGKVNRTGVWLREKNCSTVSTTKNVPVTIDLTEDPDELNVGNGEEIEKAEISNQSADSTQGSSLLQHPNDSQQPTTDADSADSFEVVQMHIPKRKYNRYILSNVPHLGHIRAMYDDLSKSIYLFWNLTDELLKFSTWTAVFAFIEKRLKLHILPVPETFKMKFAVLVSPNKTEKHPVSKEYLKGFYIYGEFGIINVTSITKEFLTKFNIDRDDIVERLTKRAKQLIADKAIVLGSMLFPKGSSFDIEKILASEEIKYLRRTEATLDAQINSLLAERREKVQRLESVLKDLPEHERAVEYSKFQSYMRLSRKKRPQPEKGHSNLTEPSDSLLKKSNSHPDTSEVLTATPPTGSSFGIPQSGSDAVLQDHDIELPSRLPEITEPVAQIPLKTSKVDGKSPETIPKLLPNKSTWLRGDKYPETVPKILQYKSTKVDNSRMEQAFVVVTRNQTNNLVVAKKPVTAVVEVKPAEDTQWMRKDSPKNSNITNTGSTTEHLVSDDDDDIISIVEMKPEVIEISDSDEEMKSEDKTSPPKSRSFLPLDNPKKVLKFSSVFGDNVKLKPLPRDFDLGAALKSPTKLSLGVVNFTKRNDQKL